jgi:multidrug efflux pump subunit AcrA (membrane-fusion protein)
LRLSELLERIRPAGAPGAPTEGERKRRRADRADEIADLAALLETFEADADAKITAARAESDRIRAAGQERARDIRSGLPDRLAIAQSHAIRDHAGYDRAQEDRIRSDADIEINLLQARADADIPELVNKTIGVIWSSITTSGDPQ